MIFSAGKQFELSTGFNSSFCLQFAMNGPGCALENGWKCLSVQFSSFLLHFSLIIACHSLTNRFSSSHVPPLISVFSFFLICKTFSSCMITFAAARQTSSLPAMLLCSCFSRKTLHFSVLTSTMKISICYKTSSMN